MIAAVCLEGGVRFDRRNAIGHFELGAPEGTRFTGGSNTMDDLIVLEGIAGEVEMLRARSACDFLRGAEYFEAAYLNAVHLRLQSVPHLNEISR